MTPKPWLPRRRRRSGTGDICLGPRSIRMGLEAGSIAAPLESGTAAGPWLKTLAKAISRASGATIHVIRLKAGSIGAALESGTALEPGAALEPMTPLEPGTETGPLLKTLIRSSSRASGTATHAIALEAVTIRTRLGPGAAREPPPAHVAVIPHLLPHPWGPP